jgi:hypothetical protein
MCVSAEEYKIQLNQSAFGLPLSATKKEYIEKLGSPDGEIKMGIGRVGLLYGQNLMLIFWNNKLWEVQIWEGKPIDALGYVRNGREKTPIKIIINNAIMIGADKETLAGVIKNAEGVEIDDLGVYIKKGNSILRSKFTRYDDEILNSGDRRVKKLTSIQVRFDQNMPMTKNN